MDKIKVIFVRVLTLGRPGMGRVDPVFSLISEFMRQFYLDSRYLMAIRVYLKSDFAVDFRE